MAVAPDLTAAILAGGKSTRMGQHKALLRHGYGPDQPSFIENLIDGLAGVASRVLIVGEPQPGLYAGLGAPLVRDSLQNAGPLSGILAALESATSEFVLICPCDTPYVPVDLAAGLLGQLKMRKNDLVFCQENGRDHPLFAVLRIHLADSLRHFLDGGGRKVLDWMEAQNHSRYDVSSNDFICRNINTLDDYHQWLKRKENAS
ncbi:MAG: molybdenum cofactor guanylyltransferase [Pseudomonadales bacterium]|nr:molybdenum cofactor guanylyltransferase [Pseudomonadales bacterium]